MNPYDPNTEPGTHFVADTLGISNVNMLNTTYRPADPLYRASTRVITSAYELNEQHDRVTVAARDAFPLLESIGRGELGRARGEAALGAARTATSRVAAALGRSGARANLGRPAHPAAAPSAGISSTACHPLSR
ncbi:hypothetical protein [Streptomyces sp. CS014]|uniref:hypothetical protein n=1 Tax=Streptomyces sp. CS014 TaxID=2162707 RepID=UPI0013A584E5|nr:hypothetical protein [Streptomyces sp. CS014]